MMKDNAMGCTLSHFDAWQTIVANGEPGGFIFEDDAIPLRDDTLMLMAELMRIADRLDIVESRQQAAENRSGHSSMSSPPRPGFMP